MSHYIAYQNWSCSGGRIERRIYGHGATAAEALWHATHYCHNGQWWAFGPGSGHPNKSDLSVEEVEYHATDAHGDALSENRQRETAEAVAKAMTRD